MNNNDKYLNVIITAIVSVVILSLASVLSFISLVINGFVGMQIWNWLLSPWLGRVSVVQAMAFSLLLAIWMPPTYNAQKIDKPILVAVGQIFVKPLILLLFGFILSYAVK